MRLIVIFAVFISAPTMATVASRSAPKKGEGCGYDLKGHIPEARDLIEDLQSRALIVSRNIGLTLVKDVSHPRANKRSLPRLLQKYLESRTMEHDERVQLISQILTARGVPHILAGQNQDLFIALIPEGNHELSQFASRLFFQHRTIVTLGQARIASNYDAETNKLFLVDSVIETGQVDLDAQLVERYLLIVNNPVRFQRSPGKDWAYADTQLPAPHWSQFVNRRIEVDNKVEDIPLSKINKQWIVDRKALIAALTLNTPEESPRLEEKIQSALSQQWQNKVDQGFWLAIDREGQFYFSDLAVHKPRGGLTPQSAMSQLMKLLPPERQNSFVRVFFFHTQTKDQPLSVGDILTMDNLNKGNREHFSAIAIPTRNGEALSYLFINDGPRERDFIEWIIHAEPIESLHFSERSGGLN